jgi:glutathione-specific gamma-glutamylcyclotransferase
VRAEVEAELTADTRNDLYVFAYGSLIWRPGFDFLSVEPARLHGYHRDLCVWSWVHRGTRESPGLVLGLAPGGQCRGVVYRIAGHLRPAIVPALMERECSTDAYRPLLHPVHTRSSLVHALTFLANRASAQWAGRLSVEDIADVARDAAGGSGDNASYVRDLAKTLRAQGMADARFEAIVARL